MDILAHAQELIYHLLDGMPSSYQRQSLQALLALFLKAQGSPLPEHSPLKSPSALSRFLNVYRWSVREVIRRLREAVRQQLQQYCPRGRRAHLQVIVDVLEACLGEVVVALLLQEVEQKRMLLQQQGWDVQIMRCKI